MDQAQPSEHARSPVVPGLAQRARQEANGLALAVERAGRRLRLRVGPRRAHLSVERLLDLRLVELQLLVVGSQVAEGLQRPVVEKLIGLGERVGVDERLDGRLGRNARECRRDVTPNDGISLRVVQPIRQPVENRRPLLHERLPRGQADLRPGQGIDQEGSERLESQPACAADCRRRDLGIGIPN